ncbi:MAG TPA: hypothetical protein VH063_07620 [Gaiellaceae bacterium]|jgi:hypothetical protein|nr:hypothetical protein [Gaiellaceae bacterium]
MGRLIAISAFLAFSGMVYFVIKGTLYLVLGSSYLASGVTLVTLGSIIGVSLAICASAIAIELHRERSKRHAGIGSNADLGGSRSHGPDPGPDARSSGKTVIPA